MIPPHLETQIRANMEQARAQAILSQMFARINTNQETAAKAREDNKLRARYWWQEKENA